jgi:putative endonuclease
MQEKQFHVYILANKRNGTLYIGMSGNLVRRVWEHRNNVIEGFTKKYGVHMLVHYEEHGAPNDAAYREKQMKAWKREWKLELIEKMNPE